MKTYTTWDGALAFSSTFDGHTIELNGASNDDGIRLGYSPKALLLSGLAGCSGIDVVEILTKMRVPFTKLIIEAEAEQTEEHPKVFREIHVKYKADVSEDDLDKFKRAIELSIDKYCGVSAMLSKNSKIIAEAVQL